MSLANVPAPSRLGLANQAFGESVRELRSIGRCGGAYLPAAAEEFLGDHDVSEPLCRAARSARRAGARLGEIAGGIFGAAGGAALAAGIVLNPAERLERGAVSPRWSRVNLDGMSIWRHHGSGSHYNTDPLTTVRMKCFMLASVGQPVLGAVNLGATLVVRPVVTALQACRGKATGDELAHSLVGAALAAPVYLALEAAALLGMVAPLTGRRLFGRLERHLAGRVAPCFQPLGDSNGVNMVEHHLLGISTNGHRW